MELRERKASLLTPLPRLELGSKKSASPDVNGENRAVLRGLRRLDDHAPTASSWPSFNGDR